MSLRKPLNKTPMVRATFGTLGIAMAVIPVAFVMYTDLHKRDYQRLPDHILALIAIIFGILAVFYEWRLHHDFATQKKDINDIVLSVHTRYLGEWPGYMRNITNLICGEDENDHDNNEILISVDVLAYGTLSAPEEYEKYFDAIKTAREQNAHIKIVVHGLKMTTQVFEKQFGNCRDPDLFKTELSEKMTRFQRRYENVLSTVPSDFNQALEALLRVDNALCRELTAPVDNPVQIATTEGIIHAGSILGDGVFFWLVKKGGKSSAMIFAYPKFIGFGKGYGFETRDDRLMEIFASQFDGKWREACEVKNGKDLFAITS
jgi:hypothetical protein